MKQVTLTGKKNGFSLLELLLVIGVMAALVGLAMPYYQDYVGQSKNSIMRANLHILRKTLMDYKADVGEFPPTLQTLVPKYLMAVPEDPESSAIQNWGYTRAVDKLSYTLASKYNL